MIWPSPAPLSLALDTAATRLSVPLRPAMNEAAPQFGPPEETREGRSETLRPGASERIEETLADGTRRLRIITDGGRERQASTGKEGGRHIDERWDIHPDDPLSARMEVRWTYEVGRGDWQTRTETHTEVTCDATHFHVRAWLRAYDGGSPFVSRDWEFRVPRDGI